MAFVHNGITLNPNKAWTHQDGRQFPAGYILTTDIATRESIGVTMVSDVAPAIYDAEYYWSAGNPKDLDELKTKKIAGAAIDVFDLEPLPSSDPLRGTTNLLMTPHIGYVTRETMKIFYSQTLEAIEAMIAGRPIRQL